MKAAQVETGREPILALGQMIRSFCTERGIVAVNGGREFGFWDGWEYALAQQVLEFLEPRSEVECT